jgi:hypothetical protein
MLRKPHSFVTAQRIQTKRSFFDRLYQHFSRLADEVEQAMIDGLGSAE